MLSTLNPFPVSDPVDIQYVGKTYYGIHWKVIYLQDSIIHFSGLEKDSFDTEKATREDGLNSS